MSKRVSENLDAGLWTEYGDGYLASVWYDLGAVAQDEAELDDLELGAYVIQYHKSGMPPFNGKRFHNLGELIGAMREIQPDMRKWKVQQD